MIAEDQYKKISDYLLEHGQQELNGHLDGIWQEMNQLRAKGPTNQETRQNVQEFQDQARKQSESTETKESTS